MLSFGEKKKSNSKESFDFELIIKEMEDIKSGKQKKISEDIKLNEDFIDRLNKIAYCNCPSHNTYVREVNQLMQTLMTMDFVREMVKGAEHQADMIETIAATSEEMVANSEDITNFVKKSLEFAHDSNLRAIKSKNLMDDAFKSIELSYNETEYAKKQIIDVNEQTEKIDEMVNIIISVAAQTNLLALNASIEAARAGESGRGFAVVANEIKKLADHTKESVDYIQESVRNLRAQIQDSTNAIEKASSSFLSGKQALAEVLSAIEAVDVSTQEIEGNMEQINLNVEQQTASSQEVASSIQIINEKTRNLHEDSIKTGKGFYDISLEIDDLRKNIINKATDINQFDSLDLCIVDHLNWRWRIYNMILGNTKIEASLISDPNKSRLGRWINNFGSKEKLYEQSINNLEKPRVQMHKIATDAVNAYNNGNIAEAEEYLVKLDKISAEVIRILREMQSKSNR